jgi:RNA polymerase I-specific transcription initiation factor RRN7
MARYLQLQHHITIPEINLPPVGWKIISKLGGTPTTYDQIVRLLGLVDTNMSLHDTDTKITKYNRNGFDGSGKDDGFGEWHRVKTTRKEDVWLPELSIAAAWVVVMKMAYGLDGRERWVFLACVAV